MRRARAAATSLLAGLCALTGLAGPAALPAAAAPAPTTLYLVTLEGPGTTGSHGSAPAALRRLQLEHRQDRVLAAVGSPTPVYRWTTALDGVAVPLTPRQADELRGDPRVALVEANTVRPVASSGNSADASGVPLTGHRRGGAGTVIGIVDTGIWPESPVFAALPGLGRAPARFHGACESGEGWSADTCNGKVVGARWFVDGFGADRLRSTASLSPRDEDGHGSEMASIAAGDAGTTVEVRDQRLGRYGGVAPQARLAVYKACWTAPDPADDGCATADLVTAIDQATRDGVDVLNLSVGGPSQLDTVERALLGAAEADVVVVGAAGNRTGRAYAAHPAPWVTTVGSTTGVVRRGRVVAGDLRLTGAMAATHSIGPARLVRGADVAAPDATRAQARVCSPGSLDAGRVRGAIVLCERGAIGRVDKSAAVLTADGAGMVLLNRTGRDVAADFHSVPTVHLDAHDAAALRRWAARHPDTQVALRPVGVSRPPARVTAWSPTGDPTSATLKPDLVAPGSGLLGAVPPSVRDTRWDFVSGSSAATAYTSGTAALLRAAHRSWSAPVVRSALATSAVPLAGDPTALRAGAGRVRPHPAARAGVAYDVAPGDYRAWLDGRLPSDRLNVPSLLLRGDQDLAHRTITNTGHRPLYFSSHAYGFARHTVSVTPAAVRLAPGESVRFTVHVARGSGAQPADDGWVSWRGGNGSRSRIPVLISR